jgi:hypothetical protein
MLNDCASTSEMGGGHKIESLRTEEGVDPVSKVVVGAYKQICTKCGMTLEEIRARDLVPQKTTRRRRSKPDDAAPATGSAPEVKPESLD